MAEVTYFPTMHLSKFVGETTYKPQDLTTIILFRIIPLACNNEKALEF